MDDARTVKIVVVGDSGVGKTALVHLLCQGSALASSAWTVGSSVDALVRRGGGAAAQLIPLFPQKAFEHGGETVFAEFWDIGGSQRYEESRRMFFQDVDGLLLVHDLSNRKSHDNLVANPPFLTHIHRH
jgi:Rab-like protein 3